MSIAQFFEVLSQNVVFLLLVLPLVGALLVVSFRGHGVYAVRRTALINVLLSTGLGLLMVSRYDPVAAIVQGELVQMGSSLLWLGGGTDVDRLGLDIRIAVGVDGVSIWFVLETVLLTLTAVLCRWGREGRNPAAYYALLLLAESALIGLFAAQDVLMLCVCLEAALLPLFFLAGLWGGAERRQAAARFMLWNLAGSVLILAGLAGVVVAHGMLTSLGSSGRPLVTFSMPQLSRHIHQVSHFGTEAERYWRTVSPWLFLTLLAGFAIKVPLFPFHRWLVRAQCAADDGRGVLLCCAGTLIGGFGVARVVLPLFPVVAAGALPVVSIVAVLSALLLSLTALTRRSGRAVVCDCMLTGAGLGLVGVCSFNPNAVLGGLLLLLSVGASGGVLMTQLPRDDADVDLSGLRADRWRRTIAVVGLGGLACIPGLSGFGGLALLVVGLSGTSPATAVAVLIITALTSIALIRALRGAIDCVDDVVPGETATLEFAPLPLMLLVVMLGVMPQFVVDRMGPSVMEGDSGNPTAESRQESPSSEVGSRKSDDGMPGGEAGGAML